MASWCFNGTTALVTGGARGIGLAIVEELASCGAHVYTCALEKEELDECLHKWNNKGYKVSGLACNLMIREEREKLMKIVSDHFNGKLNILVNNAGVAIVKEMQDFTEKDWSVSVGTNVEASFHISQMAHPLLKASGNGSLVFISSACGIIALPATSLYGLTKAAYSRGDPFPFVVLESPLATMAMILHEDAIGAINLLTKNLACEWAKDNIRVNAVAPGVIRTPMVDGVSQDSTVKEAINGVIGRAPLRRPGEATEVSGPVAFLCSPAASYITGHILSVDGGATINGFP